MAIIAIASITLSAVVDVASTTRYYLLQSSTLTPPSVPTANPPAGSWDDVEPAYTSGSTNSLYFCDLTTFSDGTWSYSSVSLSSAYEAAKLAYNQAINAGQTAQNAQNAANQAQSTADNAQSSANTNAGNIQQLSNTVSGLNTQFRVFSSGIEATVADHSEVLSAMTFDSEGLKIQMAGSIYYTLTDDTGYHIFQNDKEIASFSEGKGMMDEMQLGNIVCKKTSKGGWVWMEVS